MYKCTASDVNVHGRPMFELVDNDKSSNFLRTTELEEFHFI